MSHPIFAAILKSRGLDTPEKLRAFINPKYSSLHDPFLLPDMEPAVKRIAKAKQQKNQVVIYGDYDIDGLSATSVLLSALVAFGINHHAFIPSRFDDGYGLSVEAIERLANDGAKLVITVDCGTTSHDVIARANELGVDIIVTDHHEPGDKLPHAVAVINPKRADNKYPFTDLSGAGVAFKLVQALQTKLPGLPDGQEKWLLDLVALGTVCDIVELTDENRTFAYWGLEVLKKMRRPGLKALMAVANITPDKLNARALGFVLGPRLNASGRLETARLSLDLLTSEDNLQALDLAQKLDSMNTQRRLEQKQIVQAAKEQAKAFVNDPVLVLSHADWSHGIVGIVASKLLETYKKPAFILQELGDETKGSARSFGDFSAVEGIHASEKLVIKGGGHKLAAGLTLKTKHIEAFRVSINKFYTSLNLKDQLSYLAPKADVTLTSFGNINEELCRSLEQLEPFGNGNPEPVFCFEGMTVVGERLMGDNKQHIKLQLEDNENNKLQALAFSAPSHYFNLVGQKVRIWCTLSINEWRGSVRVEGRILEIQLT